MATYRTKGQSQKLVYVHNPFKKGMNYTKTALSDGFSKIISNLDVSPAGDSATTRRAFQVYTPDELQPQLPDIDIKTLFPFPSPIPDHYKPGYVTYVYDGDTVSMNIDSSDMGVVHRTRLLGIDAPEIKKDQDDTTVDEPWGVKARDYLDSLLPPNTLVYFAYEPDAPEQDVHDRHLCWVWTEDGLLVNAEMVYKGYAKVNFYDNPENTYGYHDRFVELEEKVKKINLGIWGEQDPEFDYPDQEVLYDFKSKYVYPLHYKYLRDRLAFIEVPESNTITESDFADANVGDVLTEISASTIKLHVKPHTYNHTSNKMEYYGEEIYYNDSIIQFVKIKQEQPINPKLTNHIDYIHFAYIDYIDAYGFIGRIVDSNNMVTYKGLILMNYTKDETLAFYKNDGGDNISIINAIGTGFNLYDDTPINIENKQVGSFSINGLVPLTPESTVDNPIININPTPGQTVKIRPIYGLADIDYTHVIMGQKIAKVKVVFKHKYRKVHFIRHSTRPDTTSEWEEQSFETYSDGTYKGLVLEQHPNLTNQTIYTDEFDCFIGHNSSLFTINFPTYYEFALGDKIIHTEYPPSDLEKIEIIMSETSLYTIDIIVCDTNDNTIYTKTLKEPDLGVYSSFTVVDSVTKDFPIKSIDVECVVKVYLKTVEEDNINVREQSVVRIEIVYPEEPDIVTSAENYLATKVERILPNGTVQVLQDLKVTGELIKGTNDDYQIIDIDPDNPQINMFDFTRSGENYDSVRFTVYPVVGSKDDFVKNDLFYYTGVIPALGDKNNQPMITNKSILTGFDVRNATRLGVFTRQIYLYGPYTNNKFLQFSGFEKEWYYPYPYNTIEFEEPIVHVHNHKDTLVVFGEHHMYLVYFVENEDASASQLTKTKIYENLTIGGVDIRSVLSVGNNVVFFNKQSGYVLMPNRYTNDPTNVTVARISDQTNNLVYNPSEYLEERLNISINRVESKYQTYVDDNTLILCVSYLVNGDIPITVMYRYNMATRLWTMYDFTFIKEVIDIFIHEPQYYNQFIVNTDEGVKIMILSNEWGNDCGEYPIQCMLNSGYIDCYGTIKDKRFRDLIFELNNISGREFEFDCSFSIDAAQVIPASVTVGDTSIRVVSGALLDVSWILGESYLPPLDRVRIKLPIYGRGRLPSFTLMFVGDGALELLNYQIVFKEKNLNRRV